MGLILRALPSWRPSWGPSSPAFSLLELGFLCLLMELMNSAFEHICGYSWKYSQDSIIR